MASNHRYSSAYYLGVRGMNHERPIEDQIEELKRNEAEAILIAEEYEREHGTTEAENS